MCLCGFPRVLFSLLLRPLRVFPSGLRVAAPRCSASTSAQSRLLVASEDGSVIYKFSSPLFHMGDVRDAGYRVLQTNICVDFLIEVRWFYFRRDRLPLGGREYFWVYLLYVMLRRQQYTSTSLVASESTRAGGIDLLCKPTRPSHPLFQFSTTLFSMVPLLTSGTRLSNIEILECILILSKFRFLFNIKKGRSLYKTPLTSINFLSQ